MGVVLEVDLDYFLVNSLYGKIYFSFSLRKVVINTHWFSIIIVMEYCTDQRQIVVVRLGNHEVNVYMIHSGSSPHYGSLKDIVGKPPSQQRDR